MHIFKDRDRSQQVLQKQLREACPHDGYASQRVLHELLRHGFVWQMYVMYLAIMIHKVNSKREVTHKVWYYCVRISDFNEMLRFGKSGLIKFIGLRSRNMSALGTQPLNPGRPTRSS